MNWLLLTPAPAAPARARAAPAPLTASDLQAQYLTDVHRYVTRRVARPEDAEDITAEVFTAAFESLPRLRRRDDPRLWLLGIARRKVADAARRHTRRRESLASDLPDSLRSPQDWGQAGQTAAPHQALEHRERLRVLREIVGDLKGDQREALLLHYADGLSLAEIAAVLRRSPAAVNSLLQRARANLYRAGRAYFLGEDEEVSS